MDVDELLLFITVSPNTYLPTCVYISYSTESNSTGNDHTTANYRVKGSMGIRLLIILHTWDSIVTA